MDNINKFVTHFMNHKLPFALWHLNTNGDLQLHKIYFNEQFNKWKLIWL